MNQQVFCCPLFHVSSWLVFSPSLSSIMTHLHFLFYVWSYSFCLPILSSSLFSFSSSSLLFSSYWLPLLLHFSFPFPAYSSLTSFSLLFLVLLLSLVTTTFPSLICILLFFFTDFSSPRPSSFSLLSYYHFPSFFLFLFCILILFFADFSSPPSPHPPIFHSSLLILLSGKLVLNNRQASASTSLSTHKKPSPPNCRQGRPRLDTSHDDKTKIDTLLIQQRQRRLIKQHRY